MLHDTVVIEYALMPPTAPSRKIELPMVLTMTSGISGATGAAGFRTNGLGGPTNGDASTVLFADVVLVDYGVTKTIFSKNML